MSLVKDCFVLVNRHIRSVIIFLAVVVAVAFLATRSLPSPRQYESRQDLRVRNFNQNTQYPEGILAGVNDLDEGALCRSIDSCYSHLACVEVFADKSSRITVRARHDNPDTAYMYASMVYAYLVDTINRYAAALNNGKVRLYSDMLARLESVYDSLGEECGARSAVADSVAALRLHYEMALAFLRSDTLSNPGYVVPLNHPTRSDVSLTPSRTAVILMALLAAICLVVAYFMMKTLADRSAYNPKS